MASRSHRFVLLLKALVALTMIYQLSLLLRPETAFLSRPYIEDTFYALSVSRSLAAGDGFSVDGVHPTNGVQPLICLLNAPLFVLGGGEMETTLRLTFVLSIVLYLFAAWMIAGFARSIYGEEKDEANLVFWSIFGLVYVNYAISIYYLNGLETALAGGLVFASLRYYVRTTGRDEFPRGKRPIRCGTLGALLGLGVLARVDLTLLVVAVILSHFIRAHLLYSRLPGKERWGRFRQTTVEALLIGGVAVLISSPWWIYNYMTFGSLMPVSGQSQQWLSEDAGDSIVETFNTLSDAFLPGMHTPHWMRIGSFAPYGLAAFPLALFVLSLFPGVRQRLRLVRTRLAREWNFPLTVPLAIFSLLLIGFYTFFFRAPHFQARYLIVPTIAILLALFALFFTLRRSMESESVVRRILSFALLIPMLLHFAFFSRNFETGYYNIFVNVVGWIGDNVEPGEKVGMFQSGTTGFVYPDIVVNLDGKVNADAWTAYRDGRLSRYVDSLGFDYFIDWDSYMQRIFSDTGLRAKYRSTDTLPAGLIVWKRLVE